MTAWLLFTVAAVACIVAGALLAWPFAAWWFTRDGKAWMRGYAAGHAEAVDITAMERKQEYERGYNAGWSESVGDDDER